LLFLFPGLAVAASGCELMPDREFAALERTLALSIVEAKRSLSGGSANFSFELRNRGSTSAKACLGPSRSVSYKVASSSGISSTFVDHPGCMREFTIQSGGVMAWDETFEVPRLSQARVEVEVSVRSLTRGDVGAGETALRSSSSRTNSRSREAVNCCGIIQAFGRRGLCAVR